MRRLARPPHRMPPQVGTFSSPLRARSGASENWEHHDSRRDNQPEPSEPLVRHPHIRPQKAGPGRQGVLAVDPVVTCFLQHAQHEHKWPQLEDSPRRILSDSVKFLLIRVWNPAPDHWTLLTLTEKVQEAIPFQERVGKLIDPQLQLP